MKRKKGRHYVDGLLVVDSTKPITVKVSEADSKVARRKDPNSCALAWAVYRETGIARVRVNRARTFIEETPGTYTRYNNAPDTRDQVVRFDSTGKFEPGEYVLYSVPPSHKLGTIFEPTGRGTPRGPVDYRRRTRPGYSKE